MRGLSESCVSHVCTDTAGNGSGGEDIACQEVVPSTVGHAADHEAGDEATLPAQKSRQGQGQEARDDAERSQATGDHQAAWSQAKGDDPGLHQAKT